MPLPTKCLIAILLQLGSLVAAAQWQHGNASDSLSQIKDSVKIGNIVIRNLFKHQVLAQTENGYDSNRIVQNVYRAHRALWDSCYGLIFGEANAQKFNTERGMIAWNRELYPQNKSFLDRRVRELLSLNIDSVFTAQLQKFRKMVPYEPVAEISILFTPLQGIGFGGCSNQQFCLELNNSDYNIPYTINFGLPHELNHMAYEKFRKKDTAHKTALAQVIDEGFACYFTWLFYDKKLPQHKTVEGMTEEEWNWYVKNEKKIFQAVKIYFDDSSGDNPLLRNDRYKLFPDAPKTLYYWLGFRIIESFVKKHGQHSWKKVYTLPVAEVLAQSGYK